MSVLAIAGVCVVLAGCGGGGDSDLAESSPAQPMPPSAVETSAAEPAVEYDISRVAGITDDFPTGFATAAHPTKTLDQHAIDNSGVAVFTHAQVDPPQCRALTIPPYAEPSAGTEAAGVSAQGDQGNVYVVALHLAQPVQPSAPPEGCDHVTVSGSPEADGVAEPVPAPEIADVTTSAAKLSSDTEDEPNYLFTAALDDRTTVVVMGSVDDQLDPPRLMSDLLVKAVSAIRGQ